VRRAILSAATDAELAAALAAFEAPVARVGLTAVVSRNNSDGTPVPWNAEHEDTHAQHDNSTNSSRLTCVKAGLYFVEAGLEFASNPSGRRSIVVAKNADYFNGDLGVNIAASGAGSTIVAVSGLVRLIAGDYLEVSPFQNSGGALNIGGTAKYNHFAWCWLRP
jgi:hypothetical protein